jgi:hypothetical protein
LEKNCHTTTLRNAGLTMALRDACICYVNITASSKACDIRDIRNISDVWHTMYSVPTLTAIVTQQCYALRDACICHVNITASSKACDIRDIRNISDVWHTMYSVRKQLRNTNIGVT